MFATPVIYPASIVPENWRWLLVANPLAAILEGFRSALTGRPFDWRAITVAAITTTVLLLVSVYVFRKTEDTFADVI
jgi:lipopolysaccharide transport system permease protein